MKKRVISISLLFIIAIFLISTYNYPLRQSEDVICKNIMEKIPLGTSFSEVFEQIGKERKWVIDTIFIGDGDFASGYDMDGYHKERFSSITQGEMITVNIGKCTGFISRTDVVANFRFDENYNLIDIEVIKYTDSL